jgi:hypothetical protein
MKRTVLITALGVAIGAGLGWLYWNYFGCTNGCAITSSPVNSSLYGALMGGPHGEHLQTEERKS